MQHPLSLERETSSHETYRYEEFTFLAAGCTRAGISSSFAPGRLQKHKYRLATVSKDCTSFIRHGSATARHGMSTEELQVSSLSEQTVHIPRGAKVVSQDPLVYIIPNILSAKECQSYIDRVKSLSSSGSRNMTRSNPPSVSLDTTKLWPLPFLSLGAGLPSLIRILQGETESKDSVATILTPVILALCASALLVCTIIPLLQRFSDSFSRRTSDAIAFNLNEDASFIRDLVQRVSGATQHPWHAWEAPVVTRYEPGAIFARHGDASPTKGSEWINLGGQRVVTVICYLNDVDQGGETSFDLLNLAVQPTKGSALVFFPANKETLEADDRTTHESLIPIQEKWIVQMFGRIRRVPPPLGLPDSYGA